MIGEKVRHYEGKNTDLNSLKEKIQQYLEGDGFKVQLSPPSEHGTVIQARKGGFLSAVIAADRALRATDPIWTVTRGDVYAVTRDCAFAARTLQAS